MSIASPFRASPEFFGNEPMFFLHLPKVFIEDHLFISITHYLCLQIIYRDNRLNLLLVLCKAALQMRQFKVTLNLYISVAVLGSCFVSFSSSVGLIPADRRHVRRA